MIKSPVHIIEINSITDDFERKELLRLLEDYGTSEIVDNNSVRKRTDKLVLKKFGIADAAHIAFAEYYKSVFITCDDKLLSKCCKNGITVQCINPVTFCEMENLK